MKNNALGNHWSFLSAAEQEGVHFRKSRRQRFDVEQADPIAVSILANANFSDGQMEKRQSSRTIITSAADDVPAFATKIEISPRLTDSRLERCTLPQAVRVDRMLLRDKIYQAIRGAILTCELTPGQELREQILAGQLNVSRSPVRDALLRLEQETLVTVLPRQGYRVTPISISDVDDIFGLRLLVHPACAMAAARAGDNALRALDRFREFAIEARIKTEFIEYNTAFHRAIEELSGNVRMAAIARNLDEQFGRLLRISLHTFRFEQVAVACAEHEAIIEALQAHDGERAANLCYEHAARGQSRITAALRLDMRQWPGGVMPAAAPEVQISAGYAAAADSGASCVLEVGPA